MDNITEQLEEIIKISKEIIKQIKFKKLKERMGISNELMSSSQSIKSQIEIELYRQSLIKVINKSS